MMAERFDPAEARRLIAGAGAVPRGEVPLGVGDEKPRCKAIKAGGGRCSNKARRGQEHCWSHSRETADERREYARRGGKARSRRSPDELETAKKQISAVTAAVLRGGVDRGTGAVALQGMNTLLRAIEMQRKLDRQAELEERLAALEGELERGGAGPWQTKWRGG